MRCGEDSDEPIVNERGDGDFGACRVLALDVVGIFSDVRGVAHLAGAGDEADQAFFGFFEAITACVERGVDAGEDEFFAIRFVEIDVCLDESEGERDLINDAVDELIEIEQGTDSLRGFLQPEEIVDHGGGLRMRGGMRGGLRRRERS